MVCVKKGCIYFLNYPVTPGLKLGAENHLALRLGEKNMAREKKKKRKKSNSTQSEYRGVS